MLSPKVLKCHEDLITLETYVQQGKTMDNKFYICENISIIGYMGGPGGGGGFNNQTGPILVTSTLYLIIIYTCQIQKQSDKNLLS